MGLLRRNTATRSNGSIMIDAAICIPVFIIALAMLLQVINFVGQEEKAFFEAETRIQTVGVFGSNLELGVSVNDPVRRISIDHVQFCPVLEQWEFPFVSFFNLDTGIMTMPFRTYIGESPNLYGDGDVYIFPKNEGKDQNARYHTKYCRTMKAGATRGLEIEKLKLADAKARGYTQCLWCIKENESD